MEPHSSKFDTTFKKVTDFIKKQCIHSPLDMTAFSDNFFKISLCKFIKKYFKFPAPKHTQHLAIPLSITFPAPF